jgi:hypothetical protein
MTAFGAFVFGALGSMLVEVVKVLGYFQRGRFPDRYSSKLFWVTRAALVLGAGVIALAHEVQTKVLAIHLGVATPLILQALARTPPPEQDE